METAESWARRQKVRGADLAALEVSSICGAAVVVRDTRPLVVNDQDVRDVIRRAKKSNYLDLLCSDYWRLVSLEVWDGR